LQPVVGPGFGTPAIAATLDANGNFSWNPVGSKSGSNVLYQWTATASNQLGPDEIYTDTDIAFSVILIPEPLSLTVTLTGLIVLANRRWAQSVRPRAA
jgi:hypothetical protein